MRLHELHQGIQKHKKGRRIGRGIGSGRGKTCGRGHKGQGSRTSGNVRPDFEGGQMPLIRRVPKRGFINPFRVPAQVVNVRDLDKVTAEVVTPAVLADLGLVQSAGRPVKILAEGDAARAFVVQGCAVSKAAREKIERAGGRIEA